MVSVETITAHVAFEDFYRYAHNCYSKVSNNKIINANLFGKLISYGNTSSSIDTESEFIKRLILYFICHLYKKEHYLTSLHYKTSLFYELYENELISDDELQLFADLFNKFSNGVFLYLNSNLTHNDYMFINLQNKQLLIDFLTERIKHSHDTQDLIDYIYYVPTSQQFINTIILVYPCLVNRKMINDSNQEFVINFYQSLFTGVANNKDNISYVFLNKIMTILTSDIFQNLKSKNLVYSNLIVCKAFFELHPIIQNQLRKLVKESE